LPVPYPNGLVVGGRKNPWQLMVEEHGSDVVEMAIQSEQASPSLVRPDLDLIVVATGHKQWLRLVEIDASNGPVVFLESVDQCTHSIIPKLDG